MSVNNSENTSLLNQELIIKKIGAVEKMKVADLGCGSNGFFVFPLAQLVGKEGLVYAVDIKKEVLENIARKARQNNLRQIKTIWSNLEIFNAAKVEPESLDVALLINTLYQSQKRVDIIREARRMLKKNGHLLIVEWNNLPCSFGPQADHKVDVEMLKNGMQRLSMKLDEEFSAGEYHYGLIFTKS
jgi:ubiquinone/menaquinone biosynthesis C-methylase UbiE